MSQPQTKRKWGARITGLFGKDKVESLDVEKARNTKAENARTDRRATVQRWQEVFDAVVAASLREELDGESESSDGWSSSPERGRSRPPSSSRSRERHGSASASARRDNDSTSENSIISKEPPLKVIFDIDNHNGSVECTRVNSRDAEDRMYPTLPPSDHSTRLEVEDTHDIKLRGLGGRDKAQARAKLKRRRQKEGERVNGYLRTHYQTRQKYSYQIGDDFDANFQWRLRERFDLWNLRNMFRETQSNIFTIHVIGDVNNTSQWREKFDWSQSASLRFRTIYVNKEGRTEHPMFWQFAIFMTVKRTRRGVPSVHCEFPANRSTSSPMRLLFEELVMDGSRNSLAFACGDQELMPMLIALDMLRASIDAWHIALQHLAKWSAITTAPVTLFTPTELQGDSISIDNLASSIHDMGACTDHLVDMIETSYIIASDKTKRWKNLKLELSAKSSALRDTMSNIKRDHERRINLSEGEWNKQQARSAKRLTTVASIFLPLTLAASLLSMGSRARDLGTLWYDWVGVCLAVGFATLVPYQMYRGVQKWRIKYRRLVADLVTQSKRKMGNISFRAFVLRYCPLLFKLGMLAVLASFLVGMFLDVDTGLRVLGAGAAAVVGILLLMLLPSFYRLIRFIWYVYQSGGLSMKNLNSLITLITHMRLKRKQTGGSRERRQRKRR